MSFPVLPCTVSRTQNTGLWIGTYVPMRLCMRLCVYIREKLAAPVSWCKSGAVCSLEVSQYNVLGAEILKISIYIDALSYIKVRVKERERAEHLRVCKWQRVIREKSHFPVENSQEVLTDRKDQSVLSTYDYWGWRININYKSWWLTGLSKHVTITVRPGTH